MPFVTRHATSSDVCGGPVWLPEVTEDKKKVKGVEVIEIKNAPVLQSKNIPDPSTTDLKTQLEAGVPLKQVGSVMLKPSMAQAGMFDVFQVEEPKQTKKSKQTKQGDDDSQSSVSTQTQTQTQTRDKGE